MFKKSGFAKLVNLMCLTLKFCNDFLVNFYTCAREYFLFVANRLLFLSLSHLFSKKQNSRMVPFAVFFGRFFVRSNFTGDCESILKT